MYHGTETKTEKRYVSYYNHLLSFNPNRERVVYEPVTRHMYTCDACGKRYAFTEQAVEEFYCGECNTLIGIAEQGKGESHGR
jgi:hypothetical protein